MQSVSVAFFDDHPTLLEGMRAIFSRRDGYKVVAIGECCDDAIYTVAEHRPDVVILDLNMPGNAFDCIKRIRAKAPSVKIIAFTASSGINHAIDALQSGANGYVLKGNSLESLTEAINTVMAGETFISKGFATKVIAALTSQQGERIKLSTREEQILSLLLQSCTNRQMADKLNLSEKTVKNYMTFLMQKLKVRNRVGLVMAARKMPLAGTTAPDVDRIGLMN